ncbi:hypothetical protein SVAN01_05522 [Stagonosporopsis vannaccii]|nr:hypothetical protein SVAN01_05522 [Stagonosporopsis vannaccii]
MPATTLISRNKSGRNGQRLCAGQKLIPPHKRYLDSQINESEMFPSRDLQALTLPLHLAMSKSNAVKLFSDVFLVTPAASHSGQKPQGGHNSEAWAHLGTYWAP